MERASERRSQTPSTPNPQTDVDDERAFDTVAAHKPSGRWNGRTAHGSQRGSEPRADIRSLSLKSPTQSPTQQSQTVILFFKKSFHIFYTQLQHSIRCSKLFGFFSLIFSKWIRSSAWLSVSLAVIATTRNWWSWMKRSFQFFLKRPFGLLPEPWRPHQIQHFSESTTLDKSNFQWWMTMTVVNVMSCRCTAATAIIPPSQLIIIIMLISETRHPCHWLIRSAHHFNSSCVSKKAMMSMAVIHWQKPKVTKTAVLAPDWTAKSDGRFSARLDLWKWRPFGA